MKGLNWFGWSNPRSGYGIVNLEYSTAVERQTGFVSWGWERKEDVLQEDFNQLTDEQKALLSKPYQREKLGIIKTTPQLFYKNESEFRIGYTMVENTKIGETWVGLCNKMDAIFVPCPFLVDVFKECGVKPPVKSVKQGINSLKFPYFERSKKDKFIFAHIGYMDERKNWQDFVSAFCSEFGPDEPVELWIKNNNPYFSHACFKDRRVRVINRQYSFSEVQKFYQLIDCLVFPSHAEGSGLPPREAMATGLPVILTNWSGLSEVCNSEFNYPLTPVAIDVPDVRGKEQPGFMARIDVSELMYWMRYVYEHPTEAKFKGKKASEFIHKNFNWDACATDLLSKIEEWA